MDARTAQAIINEFGRVLEENAHLTYGAPESLLPYDKKLIKEAIQLILKQLSHNDQQTRNTLEIGYMSIANFVSDKDAEISAKAQAAMMSRDPNHPDWKYLEAAMQTFDEISKEQEVLLKEVRGYSL